MPAFKTQIPEVRDAIRPMLKLRESYGTTAVGSGIFLPRARVPGMNSVLILLATCRDVAHRRLIEHKRELPVNVRGGAIFHAGPIVRPIGNEKYEMVSIGPTTSMRMEKFEKEFVEQTGVKLIVGKGGMGPNTEAACRDQKTLHVVFPAGCAVLAATEVEEIEDYQWKDLGMPETLWVCRVKEFGPLIVSIDTAGNNLFENNKVEFKKKKEKARAEICKQVGFIK